MHVQPTDTIETVKQKIQSQEGMPAEQQHLYFCGKLLADGCTLHYSSSRLANEATVDLEQRGPRLPGHMQIRVRMVDRRAFTVDVQPGDTTEYVKHKIHQRLDLIPDKQRLIHEGRQLEDGRTLSEYGVQHLDTLELVLRLRGD